MSRQPDIVLIAKHQVISVGMLQQPPETPAGPQPRRSVVHVDNLPRLPGREAFDDRSGRVRGAVVTNQQPAPAIHLVEDGLDLRSTNRSPLYVASKMSMRSRCFSLAEVSAMEVCRSSRCAAVLRFPSGGAEVRPCLLRKDR